MCICIYICIYVFGTEIFHLLVLKRLEWLEIFDLPLGELAPTLCSDGTLASWAPL